MILGIGTDLTDIRRIEKLLLHFGSRFEQRVFTATEMKKAASRQAEPRAKAATLAKRFAAKEACAKALGTGMTGIAWHEIGVENLPSGKPLLQLSGGAARKLVSITPEAFIAQVHLAITDEYPMAMAFVVISAEASNATESLPDAF